MKMWEIYHYIYENVCSDSYFGKRGNYITIGFLTDTEDNVKALVDKLNKNNHSYHAKSEPEDVYDEDYDNEDYIDYRELKFSTIEEIEKRCIQ